VNPEEETMDVLKRDLPLSFEDALSRIPKALTGEGFGVLTEIDVQQTMKKKLGVDFRRYRILGACNPPLAHRALTARLDVGVMMPCNVVVWEADDGHAVVEAIDPMQTIAAGDPSLRAIAEEVREKLGRVLEHLA
jgi:uncharacterized protein (DUF302 family)